MRTRFKVNTHRLLLLKLAVLPPDPSNLGVEVVFGQVALREQSGSQRDSPAPS